ncbi:hypothetical protein P8452_72278 [Trifolium repens]|nr:hypothetical protein P8452_72278 [Trifolium repens]
MFGKKLTRKKDKKRSQKSTKYQSQEEGTCISKGQQNESRQYNRSEAIDLVGTQESVQREQRHVQKSSTLDNLAPFNPNQEYTNAINQGQHHMNDQQSLDQPYS